MEKPPPNDEATKTEDTTTTTQEEPKEERKVRKNRATAKEHVVQLWHNRRLEQQKQHPQYAEHADSHNKKQVPPPATPTLCHILRQAWDQALNDFLKRSQPKRKSYDEAVVFPSVVSILQANAVVHQVETFQNNNDIPSSVLKVLPTGSDWNQAIVNMAQSRSRAFWLLDLTALIRRLVSWQQLFKSIQFLYSISSNADAKLLQVLSNYVGLVTTTKWDVECCHALDKDIILFDDTSVAGKPNGYYRQFVLEAGGDTIAIDGPDEVERICRSVGQMQQRQRQESSTLALKFILRLKHVGLLEHPETSWTHLVLSTLQMIQDTKSASCLAGISVDLGDGDNLEEFHIVQNAINHVLQHLQDTQKPNHPIRVDMTGIVTYPFAPEIVDWWKELETNPLVDFISVDATSLLVAPTGALCTRIIGVQESETEQGAIRRHYYIDDGCYGSLYQGGNDGGFCPLPLLLSSRSNDTNTTANEEEEVFLSTVWGPTCDGLDRVCSDIPLPMLERDDWLVFPNLRSTGGLNTAFNGFEPPDTAYCVLEYFGK